MKIHQGQRGKEIKSEIIKKTRQRGKKENSSTQRKYNRDANKCKKKLNP